MALIIAFLLATGIITSEDQATPEMIEMHKDVVVTGDDYIV